MNARRIVAFATAAALPSPATAGYIFNQVALTGDPAPGAGGAEFSSLSSPRLNANGDVAFEAFLETGTTGPAVSEDNDNALFGPTAGPGSGLGLIAREDQPAPGLSSAVYSGFTFAGINNAADPIYNASARGTFVPPLFNAVYAPTAGPGSGASRVINTNNAVPSLPGSIVDAIIGFPQFNNAGDITLRISASGNTDVFLGPTAGPGSALGPIAIEGDPAPGAGGAEYRSVAFGDINDDADVAFEARLQTGVTGPTITSDNDRVLLGPTAGSGSALGILAQTDDPAPGAGGAEFLNFSTPRILAGGDIAFGALLRTGNTGPAVTPDDNSAIFGPTDGPGSAVGMLLREGQTAPGTDGAEFDSLSLGATPNNLADYAFVAPLRTGDTGPAVTDADDSALYTLVDGDLQLILRTGDTFTVRPDAGPAESRTIDSIVIEDFNDARQFAVQLRFTDGSRTIALATPGSGGDFDGDGDIDTDDIDLLVANLGDPAFDLTNDAQADQSDVDELIGNILNTFPGDANLNGSVSTDDLAILAANFNQSPRGWATADFNGDGFVSTGDLAILAANFGNGTPPVQTAATPLVPEPASLALLGLGLFTLNRRRVSAASHR